MTKEVVIEGEIVSQPEVEDEQTQAQSELANRFTEVLEETAKLFELLGRAVVTTAQDMTSRVVVHMDEDTRYHMDLLVKTGASKNRTDAAEYLMNEGMKAKQPFFEKVERTNAQIEALQEQLHSLTLTKAMK